jgi:hypothetical protein
MQKRYVACAALVALCAVTCWPTICGYGGDGVAPVGAAPERNLPASAEVEQDQVDVGALPLIAEKCAAAIRSLEGSLSKVGGRPLASSDLTDDEWARLPRMRGVSRTFMNCGVDMKAEKLYRAMDLNPRDVYIPPALRAELARVVESVRPSLDGLLHVRYLVESKALDAALLDGTASEARLSAIDVLPAAGHPAGEGVKLKQISIRDLEAAGVTIGTYDNGVVRGISRKHTPETRSVLEMEQALGLELAAAVAHWFIQIGALESGERDQILLHLQRWH